jgi:hypothetical protein
MKHRYSLAAALAVLVLSAAPARADYMPTQISWPGWRVSSSEDLFLGTRHTSYPLMNLFDGRADTAWVPSGKGHSTVYGNRTVLELAPDKPVDITSIRLMTGHNKSSELFAKNDRAAEIRITVNGENHLGARIYNDQYIKTTRLKDSMGWHTVALDGRKVFSLMIVVTQRHKGTTGDLCLSELELYNGDARIDMHMPEVVRFTKGDECGCGISYSIVRRDGTRLCGDDGGQLGEGLYAPSGAWSPTGRYIASVDYNEKHNKAELCIVEAATGNIILRRTIRVGGASLKWKNEQVVQVVYDQDGTDAESHKPPVTLTYRIPVAPPASSTPPKRAVTLVAAKP